MLDLLLAVGSTSGVPPLELPPLTGLSRDLGTPVVAVTGRSVTTGSLGGSAASGALGVSVTSVVALPGSGHSLAVKAASGHGALVVGNSVVTGDGVSASVVVASASVGVTTGSSTRDVSLSGSGLRLFGSGFRGGRGGRLVVWKLRQCQSDSKQILPHLSHPSSSSPAIQNSPPRRSKRFFDTTDMLIVVKTPGRRPLAFSLELRDLISFPRSFSHSPRIFSPLHLAGT